MRVWHYVLVLLSLSTLACVTRAATPECGWQANHAECADGFCCSAYGYCGRSDKYCGVGCQSNCDAGSTCLNACSAHGTCLDSECNCDDGWTGEDCSFSVEVISSGQKVEDSIDANAWKFYTVELEKRASLEIKLEQDSESEGCRAYLALDSYPDLSYSYWEGTDATVADLNPGVWYLGIHGSEDCSYSLTVTLEDACPTDCGKHGTCTADGACICEDGYAGNSCQYEITAVVFDEEYSGDLKRNEWIYYTMDVEKENQLVAITVVNDEDGDVDVYVRAEHIPSFLNFDYVNGTVTPTTKLRFQPTVARWYIGLYAYKGGHYTMTVTDATESTRSRMRFSLKLFSSHMPKPVLSTWHLPWN